jgi:hypothetical protein
VGEVSSCESVRPFEALEELIPNKNGTPIQLTFSVVCALIVFVYRLSVRRPKDGFLRMLCLHMGQHPENGVDRLCNGAA